MGGDFRHIQFILKGAYYRKAEPGKGDAQRSAEGDNTQQDAYTGQDGKSGAGYNGTFQNFFVHADSQAGTIAFYQIYKTHHCNEK